jgi:atypical dual specificity phosphatase
MAQFGWGVERAVGVVKSKRRIAEPNFGFIQQLREYEEMLRDRRS